MNTVMLHAGLHLSIEGSFNWQVILPVRWERPMAVDVCMYQKPSPSACSYQVLTPIVDIL